MFHFLFLFNQCILWKFWFILSTDIGIIFSNFSFLFQSLKYGMFTRKNMGMINFLKGYFFLSSISSKLTLLHVVISDQKSGLKQEERTWTTVRQSTRDLSSNVKLCSLHFEPQFYPGTRHLRKEAVPTIFNVPNPPASWLEPRELWLTVRV